nr:IS66 family insertion sequence element accessory protein TnpB [uncultured Marinifilum sp.]
MIAISTNTKIFVYSQPCDMRKGFDGLSGLVQNRMQLDPMNGYLFVFFNKNRTHVKILFWDKDGFCIYYKRLEKGTFKRPTARIDTPNFELTNEELFMILRGIDFEKCKKRRRYLSTNFVD